MDLWKLKLQLHSTDGEAESEEVVETTATDVAANAEPTEPEPAEPTPSEFAIVEDEDGNRVLKVGGLDKPEEPMPKDDDVEETPQDDNAEEAENTLSNIDTKPEETKELYTPAEFQEALATGTVDDSRVPEAIRKQYQEKVYGKILENQLDPNNNSDTDNQSESDYPKVTDFYKKLNEQAKNNALKELDLTEEDLELLEYSDDEEDIDKFNAYKTAVDYQRELLNQNIIKEQAKIEQQVQQHQAIKQELANYIKTEIVPKEKNWNKIDKLMNERWQNLPYKEAQAVKQVYDHIASNSLTVEDTQVLKKYYEDTRMEFYAKQNGLSSKRGTPIKRPPHVEGPATQTKKTAKGFNVSQYKNANRFQQREMLDKILSKFTPSNG